MHKDWGGLRVQFSAWAPLQSTHTGHPHWWGHFGNSCTAVFRPVRQPTRSARKLCRTQSKSLLSHQIPNSHLWSHRHSRSQIQQGLQPPCIKFNLNTYFPLAPRVRQNLFMIGTPHMKLNFTLKLNILSTSSPCSGLQRSSEQLRRKSTGPLQSY